MEKRIFSFLLAMIMLVSCLPLPAMAEEAESSETAAAQESGEPSLPETWEVPAETASETMEEEPAETAETAPASSEPTVAAQTPTEPAAAEAAAEEISAAEPAAEEAAASEGDAVYTLENGVLTVLQMPEGDSGSSYPWHDSRASVSAIVFAEGIAEIGPFAFSDCVNLSSVTIPGSVCVIGNAAFSGCSSLSAVTFSEGLQIIESQAFLNCDSLSSIQIPEGVAAIGDSAFHSRGALTSVFLPRSVVSVGYSCFRDPESTKTLEIYCAAPEEPSGNAWYSGTQIAVYCGASLEDYRFWSKADRSAASLRIPEGVTLIPAKAFYYCRSLTEIDIPSTLSRIGEKAFYECTNLKKVFLSDLDAWYKIPFADFSSTPLCHSADLYLNGTLVTDLVIPEGIGEIGQYTFYNCTSLTSVTIPASVTRIGRSAFSGCIRIERVFYPDLEGWCRSAFESNPLNNGAQLYLGGTPLTDLVIPEGITEIRPYAFCGCEGLTSITIPASVAYIGDFAFSDCMDVKTIVFQGDVPECGPNAFRFVTADAVIPYGNDTWTQAAKNAISDSLNWCYADGTYAGETKEGHRWALTPDGVLRISGAGRLADTAWLEYRDKVRTAVVGEGITDIDAVFYAHANLTGVTLPSTLTRIGEKAFYNCSALVSIQLPEGVTQIPQSAFARCGSLSEVRLSRNTTEIGREAFRDCGLMTNLSLPESVTSIADYAFCNTGLTAMELTMDLTFMGSHAFDGCRDLTTLAVSGSCGHVGAYAFAGCGSLSEVTFRGAAASFGEYVFPENVQTITFTGDLPAFATGTSGTFGSCKAVTVVFPAGNVSWMSATGKTYTSGTLRWVDDSGASKFGTCGESLYYSWNPETETLRIFGTGSMTDYIPNDGGTRGYAPWLYLGQKIRKVILEEGVTSIGSNAFHSCSGIAEVELPGSLTGIGEQAFYGCSQLPVPQLPEGLTQVGAKAFVGCAPTSRLVIPSALTRIGYEAFALQTDGIYISDLSAWCRIRFETLQEGVFGTNFSTNPLYGCGKLYLNGTLLTDLVIPEDVTVINPETFRGMTCLTRVTLHERVSAIGRGAFADCTGLAGITIPTSVRSVDSGAFYNCTGLKDITFRGSAPVFGEQPFCLLTATARIPTEDLSWNENTMLDYGGTILWEDGDGNVLRKRLGDDLLCGWNPETAVLSFYGSGPIPDFTGGTDAPWSGFVSAIRQIAFNGSVTAIGKNAFCGLTMASITIPGEITKIGGFAFAGCNGLKTLVFQGDPPAMDASAFAGVTAEAVYPADKPLWNSFPRDNYGGTLSWIRADGAIAHGSCGEGLSYALMKDKVLIISGSGPMEDYAAKDDTPWNPFRTEIRKIVVEEGVASIGKNAFFAAENVTDISLPSTLTQIGNGAFSGTGIFSVVIPGNVTTLGDGCFMDCRSLTSVALSDGLKTIGAYAFMLCSGLRTVEIPATVTVIGADAFNMCQGLETITFLGPAPAFGEDCFCMVSARALFPAGQISWEEDVRKSYGGTILWVRSDGALASGKCGEAIVWSLMPDHRLLIEGSGEMYDYTAGNGGPGYYGYRQQVTEVVVSDGVTSIGAGALFNFPSLTRVRLPEGLTRIGEGAFANDPKLSDISLPGSIRTIEGLAFGSCCGLTELVLPESLETIGEKAFFECTGLTSVSLPGSLTEIGAYAFEKCSNLETVSLRQTRSVAASSGYIRKYAFSECAKLKSFTVPASIRYVREYAFAGCSTMEWIVFPSRLVSIGEGALSQCASLRAIRFLGGGVLLGDRWTDAAADVYYPQDGAGWTQILPEQAALPLTWHPHDASSAHVEVAEGALLPTCEAPGLSGRVVCAVCAVTITENETLPALGHSPVADARKDPTCVDTGLTQGEHCETCGKVLTAQEVLPALGHVEVVSEAVAPTCTEPGKTRGAHCSVCRQVLTEQETVPALGHSVVTVTEKAVAATEDHPGSRSFSHRQCSTCQSWLTSKGKTMAKSQKEDLIRKYITYVSVRSVQVSYEDASVSGKTISIDLSDGKKLSLKGCILPAGADPGITWSTSEKSVAVVSAAGDVTFKKPGTVTITAKAAGNSKKTAKIKISAGYRVKGLAIQAPALKVNNGKSLQLTGVFTPANATNKGISWSVNDPAAASISSSGKLTAKTVYTPVTVVVTAVSRENPEIKANCSITINSTLLAIHADGVNKTGKTISCDRGTQFALSAFTNGQMETVTWKSSASGASVRDGVLSFRKNGTYTITARAADGRTAKVTFKVSTWAKELEIYSSKNTLASGKSLTLKTRFAPDNTSSKKVRWTITEGSRYAKVSSSGVVTASKGLTDKQTVTVTATARDGSGKRAEFTLLLSPIATKVTIDQGARGRADMSKGRTLQLSARTFPEKSDQKVTWSSSSKSVATVNSATGQVTMKKPGTVTITAKTADGSKKTASFKLTVYATMTSLSLPETRAITGGKSYTFKPVIGPDHTSNKGITWTLTGDTAYATLSSKGELKTKTVTEVKRVTVTAAAKDGSGCKAQCVVTIRPKAGKVTITFGEGDAAGTLTLVRGQTLDLNALVGPEGASQSVKWKSSDSKIAAVSSSGVVTGKKTGTVTIKAYASENSKKYDTIKIRVVAP